MNSSNDPDRLQISLENLAVNASASERAELQLELGRALMENDRTDEVWQQARPSIDHFIESQNWQRFAETCDLLAQTDHDGALSALGQGVWIGVTFPIDLNVSISLLDQIIEQTPDESDGAAVAAATAVYLVDMRSDGQQVDTLQFFANQMLGRVAERHSQITSQQQFSYWCEKLELNDADKFLPRLRNVVDVLVQDDWWFDAEAIRQSLQV